MTTYQITVRGENVELRGFIAGYGDMEALADAVKPYGWIVVGSIARNLDSRVDFHDDDPRVRRLANHWQDPACEARHFIREFESAGLMVLLPDDELVERIERALFATLRLPVGGPDGAARAVLAALAAPGGDPNA